MKVLLINRLIGKEAGQLCAAGKAQVEPVNLMVNVLLDNMRNALELSSYHGGDSWVLHKGCCCKSSCVMH